MKRLLRHIILSLLTLTAATACQDDFARGESYGEGMATITATIDFKPMASALTRAADGKALSDLDYLYILIYDAEGNLYRSISVHNPESSLLTITDEERADSDAEVEGSSGKKESAEKTTKRAKFTLWDKIPYGSYYMYAVANIPTLLTEQRYAENIKTVDGLKSILLDWDQKNVTNNGEMIGCFTTNTNAAVCEDAPIVLNRENAKIHAWLRRAASKVTIAYDGSGLNDGVNIYILSAAIKDIPLACPLGKPNIPAKAEDLIHDGDTIQYYTEETLSNQNIASFKENYPCKVNKENQWRGSDHSEKAPALYFYENMQGTGEDNSNREKDDKPFGTYIEVNALYSSGSKSGTIKYRFMLGKNTTTDYDAERNCHYKLTLMFKGTANNPDWHIDFQEQVFEVSDPKVMDYRGKFFVPEYRPWTENYNLGHTFDDNTVTVSSYIEDSHQWIPWKMQFSTDGGNTFVDEDQKPDWLEYEITDGPLPYVKNVKFRVEALNVEEVDIDQRLKVATEKGSETVPYNLADPDNLSSSGIQNTANCYIVDAPGYYIFPLVYGNAIKNGADNTSAYTGSGDLPTFKDHLGKDITQPYIQDAYPKDSESGPKSAFLVWQDEPDLITYNVWSSTWTPPVFDIKYLPDAYNGKGGIQFHIEQGNIQQGNAVIALSSKTLLPADLATNENTPETGPDNFPPIMWSWHIWVTDFSFLNETDKTIEVTNHDSHKYNLMPFNLGWTSEHTETVKYYKARQCKVKFLVNGTNEEQVITLEQKSHIATTRGTSPYYQWGRKDPFVGARDDTKNAEGTNKTRYISSNWDYHANPARLHPNNTPNDDRYTTKEALDRGLLIQYPHLWHNPTRAKNIPEATGDNYDFRSLNEVYTNLWRQLDGAKTVYDPCPVGYQVPPVEAFSGFTTTGGNTNTYFEWYDVRYWNIADYTGPGEDPNDEASNEGQCGPDGIYSKNLYEFYTDPSKLQSIVVPMSGYRDWDDDACAYKVNNNGNPIGYLWTSTYEANANVYNHKYILNLEFSRDDGDGYIRPRNKFYSCDGFPVRPVKTETK